MRIADGERKDQTKPKGMSKGVLVLFESCPAWTGCPAPPLIFGLRDVLGLWRSSRQLRCTNVPTRGTGKTLEDRKFPKTSLPHASVHFLPVNDTIRQSGRWTSASPGISVVDKILVSAAMQWENSRPS